ncbi:MAG: AsmA-like C-terminal region-containing protein [Bythopirellula sp.]
MRNCGKLREELAAVVAPSPVVRDWVRKDCAAADDEKDFAITRFINICWYFFKLAAVLALFVAVGLAVFLFTRLDDEIRRQAEQMLAREFPQFNVSIGGARLVEGEGIAIYDLAISETASNRLQNNLLVVDEIMLDCDAKLTKLMNGLPELRRVVVRHPRVWATKHPGGQWNLSSFWPLPECGNKKPDVIIENAQFTLADQSQSGLPPLSLRDINLKLRPQPPAADGRDTSQSMTIDGTFGGPMLSSAELHARCDPAQQSVQLKGKFQQLQISKELLAWMAALSGNHLNKTSLVGKVDGEVTVEHQFGTDALPRVDAKLHVHEARLVDPRLPRPLTDLSCAIHCQNEMLTVKRLRGTCGSANFTMQMQRRGWAKAAPLAVGLRVARVGLDSKLYDALPPLLQSEWDKYKPTGIVDVDVQATFDGSQWKPVATLTGRDLEFESHKFPYRVTKGFGSLTYTPREEQQPAQLEIDLVGHGGGQPLRFVGQAFDPQPGALGWLEVTGTNVEIEDRMIAALPEKTREVIESMHPRGKFHVRWRIDRTQPGQTTPHTALRLELVDCRMNYDKFPYPLSGINGLVLAEDKHWTFRDLISAGSRSVQCQGYLHPLQPDGSTGNELVLQITGQQVPLDDDLRQALPPQVQGAWQELRPRGNVDLQAQVRHLSGSQKPTIGVAVSPRPESATIQPLFFPYLMEQLEGSCTYQDGRIDLSQVRARHGRTTMRTNGHGEFRDDGSWYVQLEGLAVDRLMPRRDLTDALPSKLQKLIEYLRPSGSFNLSNALLRFAKASSPSAEIESNWDLQLNCLQANLQAGIELHNIHGAIRLQGKAQGDRSYSAGELAVDTVTFEGIQFTEIQGPLWVDPGRCLFGEWATQQQGKPLRRVTARVYDGYLTSDAWVSFDVVPEYSAVARVEGANLNRLMKERIDGALDYDGKLAANLTLNGKGRSLATLAGHGEVRITEANIYELPILVSMLKVLRNETPDTTAFNQVDSKFRVQGPHIYLDQIDFKGDAVSLLGFGETNFDHQLNLNFHTVVGRNEIPLPLLNNFVKNVGRQTLQMTVNGTLSEPLVRTQALPGINNLIQQWQADGRPVPPAVPRNAERPSPAWVPWGRK